MIKRYILPWFYGGYVILLKIIIKPWYDKALKIRNKNN